MRKGLLLLLLAAILLSGCFPDSPSVGGATETETGTAQLIGEVKRADGRPAIGARIRLRQSDFLAGGLPDTGKGGIVQGDTVTDAAGRFTFNRVKVGEYQVEALYSEIYAVASRFKIPTGVKRIDLGPMTLQSILTATGRVRFSDSSVGPAKVHVLGTEHWALADSVTGLFTLIDMPPGVFDLRVTTPVPFFAGKDFPGKVVEGTGSVALGDLVLEKGVKQGFTVADGKLALAGIDGTNPVIYEEDLYTNTWNNEILWSMASSGKLDLRGNIVSVVPRDASAAPPTDISDWAREAARCRLAGMRNIPEPIFGASRKLVLPPSGRWQDIVPEANPGISLLVAEARKATVAKPLIVVSGSALTTVAQALLMDPYIADKMVVFGVYNQTMNGRDSLATYLVAKRCRFVEWGRDYYWAGPGPSAAPLPGNWLGQELAASRDTSSLPQLFFADYSVLAFLIDPQAWKTARGAKLASQPMNVSLEASEAYDIIDIPKEANDWALMDRTFFATLADSGAYHPWPVTGTVAGVSYQSMSGVTLDSDAGEGDIVTGIGAADWVEFALDVAAEGNYELVLRSRCDTQAVVKISTQDPGSEANLDLPAGSGWVETRTRMSLKQGVQKVRLTTASGAWRLSRLRFEPAP